MYRSVQSTKLINPIVVLQAIMGLNIPVDCTKKQQNNIYLYKCSALNLKMRQEEYFNRYLKIDRYA